MRIALLADPLDQQKAGIHVYTRRLVEGLAAASTRHTFGFVTAHPHPELTGVSNLVVPLYPFPGYAAGRLLVTIPRLLRKWGAGCVVEPAHFGPFNLPQAIHRITVIHDLTPLLFPAYHPWGSQRLQRLFLPGIVRRARTLVVDSQSTGTDLVTCFPEATGKTVVNYPGVDATFQEVDDPSVPARNGLEGPYFLHVGAIEPRKNLVTLLNAFDLFKAATGHTAIMAFIGPEGWKNRPFFERLAASPYRQAIRLLGYAPQADLPALYTRAIALVYPSRYEGFGLPVVEAMRCGTPCVLSRSSSLLEAGGNAALYCSPDSSPELADQLRSLTENEALRLSLREKGLQQAAAFSQERHIRQWLDVFDRLEKDG